MPARKILVVDDDDVLRESLVEQLSLYEEFDVESEGTAWCMLCSEAVVVAGRADACPRCGRYQLQVTGGDRMRVTEIEIE